MLFFSRDKAFLTFLCLLLFIPLFFHGWRFGIPYVKGGDEPHYLIVINSLLNDGDLDLKNNYDSACQGSFQAGKKYASLPLGRHVVSNLNGRRIISEEIYEDSDKWKRDEKGHPVPVLKPGVTSAISSLPEYSIHPSGIAYLLAPFLWIVKGTPYVEPLALFLANLSVLFSVFLFRRVIGRYTKNAALINWGTFLVFLGTPVWAYGRTLFTEPFLIFFALGAYLLALEKNSGLWAGALIGLGMMIKTPFSFLAIPLFGFWLLRGEWGNLLRFALGPILSAVFYLFLNFKMYGSSFHTPTPFLFYNPIYGSLGIWLSWNHGILAFSPMIFPILFSWKKFLKEQRPEAYVWGGGFLSYFLVMANFIGWSGAWSFGPREILPVIPFLMIPICYTLKNFSEWGRPKQLAFIVLCVLSLAFNALGAMDGYWNSHPLTIFKGNIS
ncbi:MAG TPA: hypothetical protein VIJ93_06845 [bacterium]